MGRWRLGEWRSISRWRTAGATARDEHGRRWAVVRIAGRRATRAACESLLQEWVRPGPEAPPRCRQAKPAGKVERAPAASQPGGRRRLSRPYRKGRRHHHHHHQAHRPEEHTSELQSLMRISYAVLFLKKQINIHNTF